MREGRPWHKTIFLILSSSYKEDHLPYMGLCARSILSYQFCHSNLCPANFDTPIVTLFFLSTAVIRSLDFIATWGCETPCSRRTIGTVLCGLRFCENSVVPASIMMGIYFCTYHKTVSQSSWKEIYVISLCSLNVTQWILPTFDFFANYVLSHLNELSAKSMTLFANGTLLQIDFDTLIMTAYFVTQFMSCQVWLCNSIYVSSSM